MSVHPSARLAQVVCGTSSRSPFQRGLVSPSIQSFFALGVMVLLLLFDPTWQCGVGVTQLMERGLWEHWDPRAAAVGSALIWG